MREERIVVTGYGIISSLGYGVQRTLDALQKGESHIGPSLHLSTIHKELPVGEVPYSTDELKQQLNIPANQTITRTPLLAMMALKEAITTSSLTDPTRTAFINGTTVGGMEMSEELYWGFYEGEKTDYIAAHDCGAGTEIASKLFGHFDRMTTVSTACSSAANSLILGCDLIRSGRVDAAIVGGTEALSKFHLNGFNSLMILEKKNCTPFDKESHGLNLGEGAAYLVIERESVAIARGARIICEVSGYANTCDAFHQTATSGQAIGATTAMKKALEKSQLSASDIDYINAHGTGTPDNDLHESIALKNVFGENVPSFSSTKSYTGHTTSAAGGVEAVISVLCLEHGFMPANVGFQAPIEETGLTPVLTTTKKTLKHVMSNSFGFGGNDSVCIFSQYNPSQEERKEGQV